MATTPKDYATALMYGPQTRSLMRRSEYLSAALDQLGKDSQKISSGGELGARLLAQALLVRQNDKARDATTEAIRSDQQSQAAALIQGLGGATPAPPPEPAMQPAAMPGLPPSPEPVQMAALPMGAALPTRQAPALTPDIDALVRTVYGEARSEDPLGQQGVASVILNRAAERGMSPAEVVRQPGQFEPWGNPTTRAQLTSLSPDSPEYQEILRNIAPVAGGQIPDQFKGADHFYSPTAQSALGRAPPNWDNGAGQDVGRHRFFDLEQGGGQQAPPMQAPNQFAALQLQPGAPPSAPAQSPAPMGGGMTPAASPPQAAAGVTTLPATPAEIDYAKRLLGDPRTFDQGRAYVMELQKRAVTPQETETVNINGVPFARDRFTGQLRQVAIPDGARTQVLPAQQVGLPFAPPGGYVQQDPLGNLKEAPFAPPSGYGATAQGYAPIQGGPADPYAPQAPPTGYQYQGGAQVAIQGGPADPRNAQNVLEGTKTIRNEIAPVVDAALKLKRNIDSVRAGYGQQNGPGDIAMINGLQRMIDEGVVREGDVSLQLKGQGWAGSLSGLKGYVMSEGFFPEPGLREGILRMAEEIYGPVNDNYRQRAMGYRSIVDGTYGEGAFDRYVFTPGTAGAVGWDEAGQPPPPAAIDPAKMSPAEREALSAAARAELQRRGIKP